MTNVELTIASAAHRGYGFYSLLVIRSTELGYYFWVADLSREAIRRTLGNRQHDGYVMDRN